MSVDAPERIWVTREDIGQSWTGAYKVFRASDLEHPGCPEYVRADKLEELAAENERLSECNTYQIKEKLKLRAALAERDKEIAALRKSANDWSMESDKYKRALDRCLARNAGGKNAE